MGLTVSMAASVVSLRSMLGMTRTWIGETGTALSRPALTASMYDRFVIPIVGLFCFRNTSYIQQIYSREDVFHREAHRESKLDIFSTHHIFQVSCCQSAMSWDLFPTTRKQREYYLGIRFWYWCHWSRQHPSSLIWSSLHYIYQPKVGQICPTGSEINKFTNVNNFYWW